MRGRAAVQAGAALLVLALAAGAAYVTSLRVFMEATARQAESTLHLTVATLTGELARFERLPQLVADHATIEALARDPGDPGRVAAANLWLKETQRLIGASDIYFMDPQGITRAASNFDLETSFIGGNFAFRPYFADAMREGTGQFYALGTTSLKRGYYFGGRVDAGEPRGVLAIKIDLDAIETTWRGGDHQVIVTDPQGVVFLSSRPDWLFSTLAPLTTQDQAQLAATRRYANTPLTGFPVTDRAAAPGRDLMTVAEQGGARRYLVQGAAMPGAGWTVQVLLDAAPAQRQALAAAGMVALGLALALMALAVLHQRRARTRERLAMQASAQVELERRVDERTRELAQVNDRLGTEVAERRAAEASLRKAQDDLVQAGKLAALGQMSAALSHEFNQPLGAARTYADNAMVLLDRDRTADARDNLARIVSLIDRMSAISRHLHSFARAPRQRLIPVALPEVVEAAREIAGLRLKAAGAVLEVDLPDSLPMVEAGPVRLQQVLVNLLTNAADAVEGQADRRIHLEARDTGTAVHIHVRDHGPGVPEALAARIFDPFFSTKGVGKGLGLGLSISYNIVKDFGGVLRLGRAEDGGAVFSVELRRAADLQRAV